VQSKENLYNQLIMSVLKIIKEYPHVFKTRKIEYTEEEAFRLIATCASKGSDLQQGVFFLLDMHGAFMRLYRLGLREPAVPLAKRLIKLAAFYQEFNIAAQACKYLSSHFHEYEDLETSKKYTQLYREYISNEQEEFEARILMDEVLYSHKHGISLDINAVRESFYLVKDKLHYESVKYHYYYYQCMCILSEGDQFEWSCEEAILYFKKTYFKHTTYLNIFRNELISHLISNNELKRARHFLEEAIAASNKKNKSWFLPIYNMTELLIKEGNLSEASTYYAMAVNDERFPAFTIDEKIRWEYLKEMIYEGERETVLEI